MDTALASAAHRVPKRGKTLGNEESDTETEHLKENIFLGWGATVDLTLTIFEKQVKMSDHILCTNVVH